VVIRKIRPTEILACIFVAGFVIAVLFSSVYMQRVEQALRSAPPKTVQQPVSRMDIPAQYVVGPTNAKVSIEAFLPFDVECHAINIGLLTEVAKVEGKRIRLGIYNMHSPEGSKAMEKRGVHCASILVNGEVVLSGPQVDVGGLIGKIDEALKAAYGSGMNGEVAEQLKQKWAKMTVQEANEFVRKIFAPKAEEVEHEAIPVAKPGGKVEVVFYMPPKDTPGAINFPEAIKRVEGLKEQYGEKLSVRVVDMMSDEATRALKEGRIRGPCALVNGSYKHIVKVGEKSTVIRLDAEPLAGRFIDPKSVEIVVKTYLGIPTEPTH